MIRLLKKTSKSKKFNTFISKYNINPLYFNSKRKYITRGIFVGLFWGFIPMPFQMIFVLLTTFVLRFNIITALLIVWLSNPITMPFMYFMEYNTGLFILGSEGIDNMELTLDWFQNNFYLIFIPLYVGTAFYSIIFSSFIYFSINFYWIKQLKKRIIVK